MKIGIDASNIRSGGGVTHLVELLGAADPIRNLFDSIVVWAPKSTLAQLKPRPWLIQRSDSILEKNYLRRALWQRDVGKLATSEGCDILFVPGGSFVTEFRPIVTMSQNLLPFQWRELLRFGFSSLTLKWLALRVSQAASFRKADGTIFLTTYAKNEVLKVTGPLLGKTAIISHGLDGRFISPPRPQLTISDYNNDHPFKLLYVSPIEPYKHQWHVAEAVSMLRAEGVHLKLDFIGSANPDALRRLKSKMKVLDPAGDFIRYLGVVPHMDLDRYYRDADLFVFASSCETFGQILIEAMAAGLPVSCSGMSAMPELLGEAGIYFNPEDSSSMADSLRRYIFHPDIRMHFSKKAFDAAGLYSWSRCADETFKFIHSCMPNGVVKS